MVASSRLTEGTALCPRQTPYSLLIIGLSKDDITNPDMTEKMLTGISFMNTNDQTNIFMIS